MVVEHRSKKANGDGKDTMKSAAGTKKVIVEFPVHLLEKTEQLASRLSTDRSKLIRTAVERFVSESERQRIDRQLAEGYTANAAFDQRICEEFAVLDAENI